MASGKTRVCIVYPADPCGTIPGGIDTFIRGEIDNAPDDIEYSVVGITTDPEARPVGRWTTCELLNNRFRFFPVMTHEVRDQAPLVPVTLRYLARLGSAIKSIDADILEFHRIEPVLRFRKDPRPRTAVVHQNMQSLYDKQADIRWALMPSLYFRLEDRIVPGFSSVFCVREDAVEHYRKHFPSQANNIHFQPTWADPRQFYPCGTQETELLRSRFASELDLPDDTRWLISVGRLDAQKNPLLLAATFAELCRALGQDLRLLIVGEGALRDDTEAYLRNAGIDDRVRFLGLRDMREVTDLLRASDLFVMSSAYEGMPMAVIEALACGVPVATTRVGEVARVVEHRKCGAIAEAHEASALADEIAWCLAHLHEISGPPCVRSATRFSPAVVLQPKYEDYRRLAAA